MGLGSSKSKHSIPHEPEKGRCFSAPLTRCQATQAETTTASSRQSGEKGCVYSSPAQAHRERKVEKKVEKAVSGMGKARIRPPKKLFLEVDHKRKAPDGLPSLAVRCGGGPSRILKVKPCSEQTRPAVQDIGTGHAMVGRRVKRGVRKGRITGYNRSLKTYQIKYTDGKEEAMEWSNVKIWLVKSDNEDAPFDDTRSSISRRSLRSNNKWKKVNDVVYGNRPAHHTNRRYPRSKNR